MTSVAILTPEGSVIWQGSELGPGRASELCLSLLELGLKEAELELAEVRLYVADLGPGSFTGVRVGIVIAKTLGWNFSRPCAGVLAFDLISRDLPVAIPARKGEFFLRLPGNGPSRTQELPRDVIGYGFEGGSLYPEAYRTNGLVSKMTEVSCESLVPEYGMEPSISMPKLPLSRVADR